MPDEISAVGTWWLTLRLQLQAARRMAGGDGPPVAAPVTQCVGASPPRAACGRVIGPWTGVRIGRGELLGSGHAVQRRGQLDSGLAIMPLVSPVVRVPSATSRAGSRARCGLPMPGLDRPWICSARCAASPERRTAFEFLVGESASDQLSAMEHDIRVRGRLRWSVGPVVADAMRGLPGLGKADTPRGGLAHRHPSPSSPTVWPSRWQRATAAAALAISAVSRILVLVNTVSMMIRRPGAIQ